MTASIWQFLESPLILIDIVAEADFGVDVVAEEIDVGLTLRPLIQTRILKQRLLN